MFYNLLSLFICFSGLNLLFKKDRSAIVLNSYIFTFITAAILAYEEYIFLAISVVIVELITKNLILMYLLEKKIWKPEQNFKVFKTSSFITLTLLFGIMAYSLYHIELLVWNKLTIPYQEDYLVGFALIIFLLVSFRKKERL